MKALLSLMVFAVFVISAVPARSAVLCAGRTGSGLIRMREMCKTNETPVDPVALGLQGPKGESGSAGPPGRDGATGPGAIIRDSDGYFVGVVVDVRLSGNLEPFTILRRLGTASVLMTVNGRGYFAGVVETDPRAPNDPAWDTRFWYETPDCTGPVFVTTMGEDQLVKRPRVTWGPLGCTGAIGPLPCRQFAYIPEGPVSSRPPLAWRASFEFPSRCEPAPYFGSVFPSTAVGVEFDLSVLGLVPPFHVEVP